MCAIPWNDGWGLTWGYIHLTLGILSGFTIIKKIDK